MNNPEGNLKVMIHGTPLWSYQLQRDSRLAVRSRKDLEVQLIAKSFQDKAFKQELLANPKVVVEQELGTKLPEELEVNVLEETETTFYMVLPSNPYEEFSEPELMTSLGMTYKDVAQWVLEQQRSALLDENSNVSVITRVWKDQEFKQELLCHPKTVIEKEIGMKVPSDFEIKVFEETAHTLYLVLPLKCSYKVGVADENNLPESAWLFANDGRYDGLVLSITGTCSWHGANCS